jgi:hypothetical protein
MRGEAAKPTASANPNCARLIEQHAKEASNLTNHGSVTVGVRTSCLPNVLKPATCILFFLLSNVGTVMQNKMIYQPCRQSPPPQRPSRSDYAYLPIYNTSNTKLPYDTPSEMPGFFEDGSFTYCSRTDPATGRVVERRVHIIVFIAIIIFIGLCLGLAYRQSTTAQVS